MASARGLRICAVAGILMASACSSGSKEATCATDSGARVCVTQRSSALRYDVQATGFLANSKMQMDHAVNGQPIPAGRFPLEFPIAADGTYTNAGGILGLIGPSPAQVTMTFSGTSGSGAAVSIPVMMKR